MRNLGLIASAMMAFAVSALAYTEHCNTRTYVKGNLPNRVFFNKELNTMEYGVESKFKSLHCCARGYRSIEWFKGDAPYPWAADESTFIISPKSGNQTIYTQAAAKTDSGNYRCVVLNDTYSIAHDVVLEVATESELAGPPRITYQPRNLTSLLDRRTRLYCEAYVGEMTMPPSDPEIGWRKLGENGSLEALNTTGRLRQEILVREGNAVLGIYLVITQVEEEDFGTYSCRLGNDRDGYVDLNATLSKLPPPWAGIYLGHHPVRMRMMRFFWFPLTATVTALSAVRLRSRLRSLGSWRLWTAGRKDYDIFLVYHVADKDVALKKIALKLHADYGYDCGFLAVPLGESLCCSDIFDQTENSDRLIIVFGRSLVDNDWTCQKLCSVLQTLISSHPRVITIFLEALPTDDVEENRNAMQELLKRVHYVEYSERDVDKFWDLLNLGLPRVSSALSLPALHSPARIV